MNFFKKLFKKTKSRPTPKFKSVIKEVQLPVKEQSVTIILRNGEIRKLRFVSKSGHTYTDAADLVTGSFNCAVEGNPLGCRSTPPYTIDPQIPTTVSMVYNGEGRYSRMNADFFTYEIDGIKTSLVTNDIQELIVFPVEIMTETFGFKIYVLEPIE